MRVVELWRYPVKSMGGERLEQVHVGAAGIPGDRAYALREDGNTRGAKKFPELMGMRAYYEQTPTAGSIPEPMVELPGESPASALAPALSARISDIVGRPVQVERAAPAEDVEYYARKERRTIEESRAIFGLLEDEPFPDTTGFPPRVAQFANPPGTFFDCYPLLVMTTSSLAALASVAPNSIIDVRRFRPNILLETDETGFVEHDWAGRTLKIGETRISLEIPCPRCVMTTIGFNDLPKDTTIMRTLVRHSDHNLGIYAETTTPGNISVGDIAEVID